MGYLRDLYDKLPEQIRGKISYEETESFVFDGPSAPEFLKSYITENFGSRETLAVYEILNARAMVVQFGAKNEREIQEAFEREVIGKIIEMSKRSEEYILSRLGEETAKTFN